MLWDWHASVQLFPSCPSLTVPTLAPESFAPASTCDVLPASRRPLPPASSSLDVPASDVPDPESLEL
ncbi:MAG: hypothetical protein ACRELY_07000 [Polyangiaceae bacterium]